MHCNQVLVPALLHAREQRGGGILYCTVLGIQSKTPIFELLTQQKSPGCNVRLILIYSTAHNFSGTNAQS